MSEGRALERIDQFSRTSPFPPGGLLGPLVERGRSVVLDIGTGGGLWALEAASLGARTVLALDRNPERVAALSAKAANLGLGQVRPLVGTAEVLPVDSGSVDLVTAALVFHEVNDLPAAIAEVGRTLREGGVIVIVELQPGDHPHHPRVAPRVLQDVLVDQGFEVQKLKEEGGWYAVVAQKGVQK